MNAPHTPPAAAVAARLVTCRTCGAEVDRDDANAVGPDWRPRAEHECHACADAIRADRREHGTMTARDAYAATVAAIAHAHEQRSADLVGAFAAECERIRADLAAGIAAIDAAAEPVECRGCGEVEPCDEQGNCSRCALHVVRLLRR